MINAEDMAKAYGALISQVDQVESRLLIEQLIEEVCRLSVANRDLKQQAKDAKLRSNSDHDSDDIEVLELQIKQLQEELMISFAAQKRLQSEIDALKSINLNSNQSKKGALPMSIKQIKEEKKKGSLARGVWLIAQEGGVSTSDEGWQLEMIVEGALKNIKLQSRSSHHAKSSEIIEASVLDRKFDTNVQSTEGWQLFKGIIEFAAANVRPGWRNHFSDTLQAVEDVQPVFRFDGVELRASKHIAGYENLWIRLSNASFGGASWNRFEFRIAVAAMNEDGYSTNPRLEFPEINGERPQFDCWYPESTDAAGSKLEMRFETLTRAMDTDVWNKLSENDRLIFRALVKKLPQIISSLGSLEVGIKRTAAQWIASSEEMNSVLAERLESLGK